MRDYRRSFKWLFCKVMSRRRIYTIMLLVLLWSVADAQYYMYSTRNFTAVDGLPQSQVSGMVEDQNGYLWLGTQGGGLARFDGREFKVYTTKDGLLSNDVAAVLIDHHKDLWIHHSRGITRFDGLTFHPFQDTSSSSTAMFKKVFEHGDSIFMISSKGTLAKIHNDSVYYWDKPLVAGRMIMLFVSLPTGEKCFVLDDGSFLVWHKNKTITFSAGFETGRIYNRFVYQDKACFRSEKGYFWIDFLNKSVVQLPDNPTFGVLAYNAIDDFFWTTNGNSLFQESFRKGTHKVDTILRDVEVSQVLDDAEGNTWFATNGRGLYKYFKQDFIRCSSDKLQAVMAIMVGSDGTSWLGTMNRGLWKIKNGKIRSYIDTKETYRNSVYSIKEAPDGTVWVGSAYGLGRYNQGADEFTWFGVKDGLSHYSISSIDFDQHGGMWVGTRKGLSYYNGKSFRNYTTADGLTSNNVWCLYYNTPNQTLYVGNDFGFQAMKDGELTTLQIPCIRNTAIIGIHSFQDSLLVLATAGAGTVIYNPATRNVRTISSQDGLASDFVYFAAEDEKNNLWIGTEKGINRVKLDTTLNVLENLYYGYDNGLIGVETNSNAFWISEKEKYFGLIDGLYEFNDLSGEPRTSFDLHLTDVKIFYGDYSARDYADSVSGFYKIPVNLQLPPDKNHITFYFNRVDKHYPKSVKFKYYLENFDKTWSQPSSMDWVTYSNLPPGDYVLNVLSTDNKGSWDEEARITYAFSVKAPFYQTASFIIGVFILLGGIITLILYLRVKQKVNKMMMLERIRIKEQETLRKEIARDFHDEMGNQLTRIINYISLLKLNSNGNGNGYTNGHTHSNGSHDLYTKVEDSAKYLYTGTRDFIWSIDPVNDELSKLFIHIRDFGEKLFEEKSIQFRAFNEVKERVKLPYGFSREANLIFKEAMTNAFKYSQARNVSWQLNRLDDGFEMYLRDDGIGFYTDEIEKSNGLQNIRERADRIHAFLRIHSEKNKGTTITLSFKLTKTLKYGLAL